MRDLVNEELELARPAAFAESFIETRAPVDAQSIFDTVAKHLATQGRKSLHPQNGCVYRSPNGDMCAVGVLLDDEDYRPSFEGCIAKNLPLPPHLAAHRALLGILQFAHDDSPNGAKLMVALQRAALRHDLSPAILDTLTFPDVWA